MMFPIFHLICSGVAASPERDWILRRAVDVPSVVWSGLRGRDRATDTTPLRYFAAEIIGNILGLEPRKWLRPKKIDFALNKERARTLGTKFQPYNWTVQLEQQ